MRPSRQLALWMLALLASGCSDSQVVGAGLDAGVITPDAAGLDMAQVSRLTHEQYDQTVADLLGPGAATSSGFPAEARSTPYSSSVAESVVSAPLAEAYILSAESLAARAAPALAAAYPCDAADQLPCARTFIESFGLRAQRRPLPAARVDALLEVFAAVAPADGYERGLEAVTAAFLQSPRFLYRIEDSSPLAGGTWVPLDGWELASRLSYLLWGTMPDDELFALAASGELTDPEVLEAQATRMLADPRARRAIGSFFVEWLQLDRLDDTTKVLATSGVAFDRLLRADLASELRRFVEWVLWEGDGRFQTLMTAPVTFVNTRVAAIYGVATTRGARVWERRDLDPTLRAGVLTQPGFLSVMALPDQTDPVRRGLFVRSRLLCQTLPLPDAEPVPPEVDPTASTRERYQQHMADPACASCHTLMDPIGFGFERLDLVGRARTTDGGSPVDDRGELVGTLDIDGPFTGPVELAHRLAESPEVHTCFVAQWFEHAFGRKATTEDAASLLELEAVFAASGQDVRRLIIATVRTQAFRHRRGY